MKIDNLLAQDSVKLELPKVKMDVDPAASLLKKKSGKDVMQDVLTTPKGVHVSQGDVGLDERSIELDPEKLQDMAEAFNNFMLAFDHKFNFSIHEGSNQLMVRIMDVETDTVLREIPAEETLELAAKIRDFVGLLVDKQA